MKMPNDKAWIITLRRLKYINWAYDVHVSTKATAIAVEQPLSNMEYNESRIYNTRNHNGQRVTPIFLPLPSPDIIRKWTNSCKRRKIHNHTHRDTRPWINDRGCSNGSVSVVSLAFSKKCGGGVRKVKMMFPWKVWCTRRGTLNAVG